mmetsp:Transcript_59196/g.116143  ORF Transcript_59196/g.116143 Transcript_59196/m.116143 type:complete len:244 (+) Transcript_59196:144-875(+)
MRFQATLFYILLCIPVSSSFVVNRIAPQAPSPQRSLSRKRIQPLMGVFDFVNPLYWKREYITAAMLSRQVPSSASVVLELYPDDGKRFYYYPSTVSQIVVVPLTWPLEAKKETELRIAANKVVPPKLLAVKQTMQTMDTNAVDVVVCVQALKSLGREGLGDAHRVLKPGGRLIFVEPMADFAMMEDSPFSNVFCDEEDGFAVGYAEKEDTPGTATPKKFVTEGDPGPNRRKRREKKQQEKRRP